MEVGESRSTSMEGSGRFHGSQWNLPWKYMEVLTVDGSGSFHYFHQL